MRESPNEDRDGLLDEVKAGMLLLGQALKSCALYPEGARFRVEALAKLQGWLSEFLAAEEALRLTVEGDRLLYQGETVYLEKGGDLAFSFPLFRDGAQWIEFQSGLTGEELQKFFALVNEYRQPRDDEEEDLITAMWEAGFQSIAYKTVNDLWDIDPLPDLLDEGRPPAETGPSQSRAKPLSALFQEAAAQGPAGDQTRTAAAEEDDGYQPGHIELWRLTKEETIVLRAFIEEEARRDFILDGLDVVMFLLRSRENQADEEEALSFLVDQVKAALGGGGFGHLGFLCRRFDEWGGAGGPGAERLARLRLEFKSRLAEPAVLAPLAALWPDRPAGREALIELRTFLLFLPPESVGGVAAACARTVNRGIQRLLLSALAYQVGRSDLNLAAKATAPLPPPLVLELLAPADNKKRNWPLYFLEELTRHKEPEVRLTAADLLRRTAPDWLKRLGHLAADRDPRVNRFICDLLGSQRHPAAEIILHEHLSRCYAERTPWPEEQLLNCYLAFGRCASSEGADFLQRILLKSNLKALFSAGEEDGGHRLGAALALMRMPPEWSGEALRKAAHSPFRPVRQAVLEAEARAARGDMP